MAMKERGKPPAGPRAGATKPETVKPGATGEGRDAARAAAKTRAEKEFAKYRARVGSATGAGGLRFGTARPFAASGPRGGPGAGFRAASGPGGLYGSGESAGSFGDRLSETLRMSIDAVNAGLAGGLRILGGLADMGYGMGARGAYGPSHGGGGHGSGHGGGCGCGGGCGGGRGCGCGGGCGCESCCPPTSCGYDCCCIMGADPCCRPGVHNCPC